jgi:hypothetical protein
MGCVPSGSSGTKDPPAQVQIQSLQMAQLHQRSAELRPHRRPETPPTGGCCGDAWETIQIYGQHLGIYTWGYVFFLFIGYIPHMVVNISSDLRPDLLVVRSQVAEMSQAAARREPGRAASAPGLKKFWNRRLMAMIYVMGIV